MKSEMRNMKRKIGRLEDWKFHLRNLLIISVIFFSNCKKDAPTISTTPEIQSVTASPATVIEYQDKITFTVAYTDGDGDLGENNPDAINLFLTDLRNNVPYEYRIQQLAPDGATIAIKGTLEVVLNNVAILGSGTQESATFSIYMKDRAGNTSNTFTTAAITVKK